MQKAGDGEERCLLPAMLNGGQPNAAATLPLKAARARPPSRATKIL
jgi:hypothetical protein